MAAAAADGVANGAAGANNAVQAEDTKLPLLEDIMQLARIGDVEAVRPLLQSGKFTADYADKEGITPLHVRTPPRLLRCTLH